MSPRLDALPSDDALGAALAVALGAARGSAPTIVARRPNNYESRARTEVLTCRDDDGTERLLLCKYEPLEPSAASDVAYEAEIYRQVVQPLGVSAPQFLGAYLDEPTGATWLFLEYLDSVVPLSESWDQGGATRTAELLGRFHAAAGAHFAARGAPAFLKRFDTNCYMAYAARAVAEGRDAPEHDEWLVPLLERTESFIGPHLGNHATVVHGDSYNHNVLTRGERIYLVDWEGAGRDLGEMDLASLIDGWDPETESLCVAAYRDARWPTGAPDYLDERLDAARMCLYWQNLATRPHWPREDEGRWYARRLRALGRRVGLIDASGEIAASFVR